MDACVCVHVGECVCTVATHCLMWQSVFASDGQSEGVQDFGATRVANSAQDDENATLLCKFKVL